MSRLTGEQPFWNERNEARQELGTVIALERGRARREAAKRGLSAPKPCGHDRHVGPCPACQRAQLARWRSELAAVGS
jgi:hypothetical protein